MLKKEYIGVPPGIEATPAPKDVIVEKDVKVAMPDGVKIALNVYRPEKPGKYPVVMCMTPYSKDAGPMQALELIHHSHIGIENGWIKISELTTFEGPDPVFWVRNGYVTIHIDVRGMFASEGTFDPVEKANDYYRIIEWAAVQEWSDGNVGLNGVSALAESQYQVACLKPPHLKAIIPWESFTDRYRQLNFPGGIPETFFWLRLQSDFFNIPEEETKKQFPLLIDPVRNQDQKNNAIPVEKIEVPMLECGSWADKGVHTPGSFDAFRRSSSKEKWLYTHGGIKWERYYSEDAKQYQKNFFDYYLKGIDNGWKKTPAVRLEIRDRLDDYEVRFEHEWPIARTQYTKLYLDPGAEALKTAPLANETKVRYNPRSGGSASFELTFDEDTELSGYMIAKLWVSTENADDIDIFVGVRKFDVLGNELQFHGNNGWRGDIVTRAQMRVSLRELDEKLSTPFQPVQKFEGEKRLAPGEIVPVEIALQPSSTLFRKGESMRFYVQGRELVINPIIGYRHPINKGPHIIHTGGKYDSYLLVPMIPR